MVPKIHARGTSFKGAAAYLLRDKDRATTSGRVAWVETVNLSAKDPDIAWRLMAATAMDAPRLKEQAGVKKTGRTSKDSVLHISLAWAPGEKPTREEMSAFARRALQALGADDRQAMIICHTDEKHPHVHLLINRVSMTDGRMLPAFKEKLNLSELALAYEKERGQVHCPEREVNAKKRAKGEYARAEKDIPRPDYEALKEAQAEVVKQITPQMQARNPQAAAMIRMRMKKQFRAYLDGIKAKMRPEWQRLYARQRAEAAKATEEKTAYFDRIRSLMSKGAQSPSRSAARSASVAFRPMKEIWQPALRAEKQQGQRVSLARKYADEIGKALNEIKFQCQGAIRQIFVGHDRGGVSKPFGPAAAGMTPEVTKPQSDTQRRVTQLSEKFKNEGGLEPREKWKMPTWTRQPGRPKGKDKDKDHEPEI